MFLYRVVNNLVFENGKPIIPTADRITKEGNTGFYIAYKFGKPAITLVVIANEPQRGILVGAESKIMDLLPDPKYTLDEYVDADPSVWKIYRYKYIDSEKNKRQGVADGFGNIPKGILVALGVGAPLPVKYLPFDISGDVIGLKPEYKSSCGPFHSNKCSVSWYGDATLINLKENKNEYKLEEHY